MPETIAAPAKVESASSDADAEKPVLSLFTTLSGFQPSLHFVHAAIDTDAHEDGAALATPVIGPAEAHED